MLTKSELVGAEGLLWVSSIATNCFIVSMSMEGFLDLALVTGVTVRAGGHRSSAAMKHEVCGIMDLF